jgi:hypothetical protein
MGISSDKYGTVRDRAGSFPAVLQTIRNLLRWLAGFFVLTEEDQSKAGIYLGSEGRH